MLCVIVQDNASEPWHGAARWRHRLLFALVVELLDISVSSRPVCRLPQLSSFSATRTGEDLETATRCSSTTLLPGRRRHA